jgi:membrane-associated phospholipid phosphatase
MSYPQDGTPRSGGLESRAALPKLPRLSRPMASSRVKQLAGQPEKALLLLYFASVGAMVARIAWLDAWGGWRWGVLAAFTATVLPDRVALQTRRGLGLGLAFFAVLSGAVTYLPNLWFSIAYRLNHAEHYLWNANAAMQVLPWNDGAFLWRHRVEPFSRVMAWVYENGFDMVVWIPVVRSLVALDARKMARYALAAHLIQFPLIMPFYTAIRVDEVWSVLGHPDRMARGWSDEVRLDLGANCFPSMHTSVAFAILLLGLRERSALFRWLMAIYASSIIFSTVYMEIHWLVDVAAGLVLGAASVKLADRLLARFERPLARELI